MGKGSPGKLKNYRDGRVQGVGGTASSPATYQYGADTGADGHYHEYTLTTKLSASGGTNEWTKNYTDGVGRSFKTIYASNAPPYPYS
jgi:hypothetical protein